MTREDAVTSVHAGFRDGEIAALWPGRADEWRIDERAAGLFGHCFVAERRSRVADAAAAGDALR